MVVSKEVKAKHRKEKWEKDNYNRRALRNYTLWCVCNSPKERHLCPVSECKVSKYCNTGNFDMSEKTAARLLKFKEISAEESLSLIPFKKVA